jgi:monooxygenase
VGYPWRLNQEYVTDRKIMQKSDVSDGILGFHNAPKNPNTDRQQEHAEAAE